MVLCGTVPRTLNSSVAVLEIPVWQSRQKSSFILSVLELVVLWYTGTSSGTSFYHHRVQVRRTTVVAGCVTLLPGSVLVSTQARSRRRSRLHTHTCPGIRAAIRTLNFFKYPGTLRNLEINLDTILNLVVPRYVALG